MIGALVRSLWPWRAAAADEAQDAPTRHSSREWPQASHDAKQAQALRVPTPDLLKRYGVNPEKVMDELSPSVSWKDVGISKSELLERILQAHEHARKGALLGNISDRHFGANVRLANGAWFLGTNIEQTRQITFCAERGALVTAYNTALRDTPLEPLIDPRLAKQTHQDLGIQLLAIADHKAPGRAPHSTPCADCQSWMATQRYFSPNTLVASLGVSDGVSTLRVRRIADMFPLLSEVQPTETQENFSTLPMDFSESARAVMSERAIEPSILVEGVERARRAATSRDEEEAQRSACAVLMGGERMYTAARTHWSTRKFEEADLQATARATSALFRHGKEERALAVAYYGKHAPSIRSLNILAQSQGSDMLVVTCENNRVQVRTAGDFVTEVYRPKVP